MTENKNNDWWQRGVTMFLRLSAWVAGPVIIGVFLGKWLDQKYNTKPWLFLIVVGLAFGLSMFGLVKEAAKEFKNIDKNTQHATRNTQQGEKTRSEEENEFKG